ncbi:MAG TPA: TolC family protein [Polyangiaceae bacterium]|jgi:outer membrane protein TolC|nr:TolC family protein [Polyangiaceae bacterium]
MIHLRLLSLVWIAAPFGCATTAGTASYGRLHAAYERSLSSEDSRSTTSNSSIERLSHAPTLDRAAFVRAVLRQNPSIESARQGWRAALARVRQAGAFEDPMVDLAIAPLSIGSSNARAGYEVGISQKLPWFGKRTFEASAAAAEAEAVKNDFEATRRDLALTAVALYDQYFVAARSLDINAAHLDLMRSMQGGATAQFEAGRGSAQDPLQAESELAHLERDAAVLAAQRDVVAAQMNDLLHRDPDERLPPPPQELSLSVGRDVRDPQRLETEATATRPEIVAIRDRARAEQSRADKAAREYYPDVTVSTSYSSMWDMPEHRWMVGLGFNLPIWTGARGGAADEAAALRAQFESDACRMEASARTQVYVSLKQLDESEHVLRLFEERLLPVARDQIEAARAGFTASRNPFMAVIEAERNLRTTELDYQVARADCDRRHAELERALGRIPGVDGKDGSDGR